MDERAFCTDLKFPNQYYGVLVRSSIQRGRLVNIKSPPLPDGYHLYTATDIPGENRLRAFGTSIPVFTPYEIAYFGEPLGVLVGPDLTKVRELVAEVLIETEKLDPLHFDTQFAASQVAAKRVIYIGDPDQVFEGEGLETESTTEIGPSDHYYAEPLAVNVNLAGDRMDIHLATQWPFHVRNTVSAVLDLDPREIRVAPTALGDPMDGKIWFPSLLAAQAALASVLCKHPVQIAFTRQEDFLFSGKSAPVLTRCRSKIGEDGKLKALIVRILVNAGAYSPLIDEIVDRISISATGLYEPEAYRVETWAIRTSLPPMGTLSGWGESSALLALESHFSKALQRMPISPVEWKLLNLRYKRTKKQEDRAGITDDIGEMEIAELLEHLCIASDFPRKYAAYSLLANRKKDFRDGTIKSISLATGFQGNGFTSRVPDGTKYSLEMTMETDGILKIFADVQSSGMRQAMRRTAADILGIEEDAIEFAGVDTDTMSETGPDTLSAKLAIQLPLLEKACATIQKQRFRQPLPISVKKIWTAPRASSWNQKTCCGTPFISTTPGACAVELELNPATYEVVIQNIWIACNAGKIRNKNSAATALRKSAYAALSKTLTEHITVKDGKLAPRDSIQYNVLSPAKMPDIHIMLVDSESPSRGIGTIAGNLIPAAYNAALSQIIGKQAEKVPAPQDFIWAAMHAARKDVQ